MLFKHDSLPKILAISFEFFNKCTENFLTLSEKYGSGVEALSNSGFLLNGTREAIINLIAVLNFVFND